MLERDAAAVLRIYNVDTVGGGGGEVGASGWAMEGGASPGCLASSLLAGYATVPVMISPAWRL